MNADYSFKSPRALLTISNAGKAAVKWGYGGAWLRQQTATGWTTNNMSFGGILESGHETTLTLRLQPDTRRWQVGFVASQASTRQRVSFKLGKRWDGRIRMLGHQWLSNAEGPKREFWSDEFEAPIRAEEKSDAATNENIPPLFPDLLTSDSGLLP